MSEIRTLIDRLVQLSQALGVLCALRSMLANMKVCQNTLDGIFTAEEVVAAQQVEVYEEIMRWLGYAGGGDKATSGTEATEGGAAEV